LERPQKSKKIYWVKNSLGDEVPLCSVCLLELEEEKFFLKDLEDLPEDE
jgi:hypothetical protein